MKEEKANIIETITKHFHPSIPNKTGRAVGNKYENWQINKPKNGRREK
jgi:hypothetical protein